MDNRIDEDNTYGTGSNVSVTDSNTNQPHFLNNVSSFEIKLPFQKYSEYFNALKLLEDNCTYQKYEVKCKLCISSKSLTLDSRSSSNIIKHLRKKHSSVLKEIENKGNTLKRKCVENEVNTKKLSSSFKNTVIIKSQPIHDFTVKNKTAPSQESLNSVIANFIISASLPFSIIENDYFKEIINLGFPDLKLLTHSTLIEKIKKLTENLFNILKERISIIEHITTTVNWWSINKRSYIGITGHWINPDDLSRVSCLLAIKRIKGKHMYNTVANQIMSTYDFFHIIEKVNYTTTDNGLNFVKSSRIFGLENQYFENETLDNDNLNLIDDSDEPVSDGEHNDVDPLTNEESAIQISITELLHGDEYSNNIDPLYVLPKHQRCAAHTLNLVASIDISIAFDSSAYKKQSIQTFAKCNALWSKQIKSTTAADIVKNTIGVYIKTPSETRWNSTYDSVQWILSYVKINLKTMNTLCDSLKLVQFTNNDVIFLEEFCETMRPITIALDILQSEKNMYLGYLLPTITQLQFKYDELSNSSMTYCKPLAISISLGIARRFKNQLKDPFLIISSVSHPLFKTAWIQDNEMKNTALTLFKKIAIQVNETLVKISQPPICNSEADKVDRHDDKEINFFPWSFNSPENKTVEKELNIFLNECPEKDLLVLNNLPTIKKIFLKYNTPMPCSSPIEKQFNIGKALFNKRRAHISDEDFERVMLLKLNKLFL